MASTCGAHSVPGSTRESLSGLKDRSNRSGEVRSFLVDLDLLRLRGRRLGQRDLQHALAHIGLDRIGAQARRQRQRAFERAVAALDETIGLVLLFLLGLLVAAD